MMINKIEIAKVELDFKFQVRSEKVENEYSTFIKRDEIKLFLPGIREKVRSVRVRNVCSTGPFIVLLKISVKLGQEHVSAITI